MTVDKKRKEEQSLLREMIALYCRGTHKETSLCPSCCALLHYAQERSAKCPHMKTKTFCSNCKTHCYKPEMREKIRSVMRYAGPRMLFHHPILLLRHAIAGKKESHEIKTETVCR